MPQWLALALLALTLWGVWGFLAKVASTHLDARTGAALQGLGAAVVTLALLGVLRFRPEVPPGGAVAALAAGAALWLGIVAFTYALGSGGKAAVVVPLTALYPLVTIVLSLTLLKEQLTPLHGVGVVLALAAMVLLSR